MRTNPPCKRSEYWGRGGAGVLFTCSEDGTVLLLLRAEWVEQGGTWGIPGGGIGEGFYATPMKPITDLDVFRRKAQQEAEEECGALPPYMTSLPEGLPYTQYEDCGFRYVTFILDIPKATKDAWAPYSADGENDAFVWFPLAEVKRGRPLPDEHGDLHDIHFGVKFTMDNLPPRANPRPSRRLRRNPLRIDVRYKPEEVALYQTSRAVRSVVSPALQRRNVERMVDTPHNFIVVLETRQGEEPPAPSPGAVTLGIRVPRVADDDNYDPKFERPFSEGIYTAFTYLHKLGAILTDKICGDDESRLPLLYPSDRPKDPVLKNFYRMVDTHLGFLAAYHGDDREEAYYAYTRLIGESVNSKMVREGYSLDWMQAFADIFALCELTPASRPLLLPIEDPTSRSAPSRQWRPALPEQDVFVFNQFIVADFNKRFRAFYNTLIPSLYGRTFWLV